MRDFLIKNVSNIYCLLKMDDLEVFGITKSCFEMNYPTNNFLTFFLELYNRFSQSL